MTTLQEVRDQTFPASDPSISVNDYCALLPKQRWSYTALGRLLYLPRTGLVVCPYLQHQEGSHSWATVVVVGNDTYRRGGYNLDIGKVEIETAIEIDLV